MSAEGKGRHSKSASSDRLCREYGREREEKELKYVLLRKEELKEKGKFLPGAKELLADMKEHGIEVLSPGEGWEKPAAECLLLAATDGLLRKAGERNMAAAAFENEDYPGEARTDSPVLLQGFEEIDCGYLERIWQRKQGIPWRILETERCYLRELELEDLDDLYELYAQEGMTDFIEPLYTRKKEEEYQRAYIQNMYGFYGYGMWLVKEKGTNRLIGRAGLENREIDGNFELELGYAIAVPLQRQGYATEVCLAILDYAWKNLGYEHVNCLIEPENTASIGLVKKLGFTYEGELVQEHHRYERYVRYRE